DLSDDEFEIYQSTIKEIRNMDAAVTTPKQPDPATLRLAPGPTVVTNVREYSVAKAIAFGMQESGMDYGLEKEIHTHLVQSGGKSFQGVAIPLAALFKKDGQSSLTSGAGGALAATDILLRQLLTDA